MRSASFAKGIWRRSSAALGVRFPMLGLWTRMALAISLGFIALFFAFWTLSEQALKDSTTHLLDERLVIAQMAANQIDGLLEQIIAELSSVTPSDIEAAGASTTSEKAPDARNGGLIDSFPAETTYADSSGIVRFTYAGGPYQSGTDLSDVAHVDAALAGAQPVLSDPYLGPDRRSVWISLAVPAEENGRVSGVLIKEINLTMLNVLEPLTRASSLGKTGHASLVDSKGSSLATTLELPALSPGEHAVFYRAAMGEGIPVIDTVPFELDLPDEPEGELHVMAFAPLENAPWGVAVGGDEAETFAGIRSLRLALTALGIMAVLVASAVTLVGTRSIVRPIRELTQAAEQIANGNLQRSLPISNQAEIGVLARTLEHMRLQLIGNIEALAYWNEALESRVREQTKELRQQQQLAKQLLQQAITAQEDERARLARELHDEIGQTLTAVELSIDRIIHSLPETESENIDRLEKVQALTEEAMTDLRRLIADMRPGVLDELGLLPALGWLSDHALRPLGIQVRIETEAVDGRLPTEIETILFRIAQEAMNNVARHSQAENLLIRLEGVSDGIRLILVDDGRGMTANRPADSQARDHGLGLAGMRERAAMVGGVVEIESEPGAGTHIRVSVPLPRAFLQQAAGSGSSVDGRTPGPVPEP